MANKVLMECAMFASCLVFIRRKTWTWVNFLIDVTIKSCLYSLLILKTENTVILECMKDHRYVR